MIPYFSFTQIQLGPVVIQVWGLAAALGFLSALFLSAREAKKKGIDEEYIWDIMVLSLIGVIVGSKTFYIISNPGKFDNLINIFNLYGGGFSLWGGIALASIFGYIYARIKKINLWKLADVLTPGAITAIIITRIGCFLVDDHIGKITDLPWGRLYINGTIRHPMSLYLILNAVILLLTICYLKKKHFKNGILFLAAIFYYSVSRFLLDFLRCSDLAVCDSRWIGLTYTQWFLLALMPFVVYLLVTRNRIQLSNK